MTHPEWQACDCIDLTAHELRIEVERLEAEVLEARNEAATVRRAYLHEKERADAAIVRVRGLADELEAQAYNGRTV